MWLWALDSILEDVEVPVACVLFWRVDGLHRVRRCVANVCVCVWSSPSVASKAAGECVALWGGTVVMAWRV